VKRQDPVFGAGSYGHISRLVPEHLFVMYKQMERLKDGGWKDVPEFAGFLKAFEGVESAGHINKGGKEFFERLPDLFFERFNETFNEHTKKWRTPKTIAIIVAGHPQIAKAFLRWLFDIEETFPNEDIELKHHYFGKQPTKINVSECLHWLIDGTLNQFTPPIQNSDPTSQLKEQLLEHPLIQELIEDLKDFANCDSDDSIDMLDSETWKNKPYNFQRAEALIWNTIAPRAAHQQRVENLVQTAGHLGKTHVEEVRRSARAKIHSIFYCDFKIWALDIVRKEDEE
jgi:hypothetical protein